MKRTVAVNLSSVIFYFFALLALVVQYILHQQAGLSFPIPWPDEAHFLWQAYAFCYDNTLFTTVLNTDRTIMWMPPGYMVLMGLLFKLTGPSLEIARQFSFVTLGALFILLLHFLKDYGHRWFSLILTILFFLNGNFIACGNVARMEGILLVFVVCAFVFIQQNRLLLALCLLALTPLLHLNGLFFCLGGVACIAYRTKSTIWRTQVNWLSVSAIVLTLAAWIGYALFVSKNWDSFLLDMLFQFDRKGGRNIWKVLMWKEHITLFILLLIGAVYAYKSKIRGIELLFLAVPAWFIWVIGQEMWYEVFRCIGYLCITLFAIQCWFHLMTRNFINRRPVIMAISTFIFLFFLIRGDYRSAQIPNPFTYPAEVRLNTMRITGRVPYIDDHDRTIVSTILRDLSKDGNRLSVEFEPIAAAFLFLDMHEKEIQLESPLFQTRQTDLMIVHWSARLPGWWKFSDSALARVGLTKDSVNYVWHTRDITENWYFVPMSDKMRALLPEYLRF